MIQSKIIKASKKLLFTFLIVHFLPVMSIAAPITNSEKLSPLFTFYQKENIAPDSQPPLKYVNKKDLPQPYQFLLTQPLMTMGIAQYYQRTPKVRTPLYVENNRNQKTYSRAIIMIVDNNKTRNNAILADKNNESSIVELGLITMNFSALPDSVVTGVLHSQIPFGALLVKNNIKTQDADMIFFSLTCTKDFSKLLNCPLGKVLYGRTNTLVRVDNGQWVAHVVEILSGIQN
jgi:hypothetical protein